MHNSLRINPVLEIPSLEIVHYSCVGDFCGWAYYSTLVHLIKKIHAHEVSAKQINQDKLTLSKKSCNLTIRAYQTLKAEITHRSTSQAFQILSHQ